MCGSFFLCVCAQRSYLEVDYVSIAINPTTAMQYHHLVNFLSVPHTFASLFPKKSQYLVNGESDKKSDRIKQM